MAMGLATKMAVNVMIDKKPDRIREQLQEEIEKLREQGEVPEILDLIRQIEKAKKGSKNRRRRTGFSNDGLRLRTSQTRWSIDRSVVGHPEK
jgi:hypothetical protein